MGLTERERERQAERHGEKAISLRMAKRPAEAMQHADQGVALVEALLAGRPGDPLTMHVLASQLYVRAAIWEQLGQPERGIADARRSMELYQELAPLDSQVADIHARATPRAADAMARLGRLTALAPHGPDLAAQACDAVASAVRIYDELALTDPRYRSSLARVLYSQSEVFRLVGTIEGRDTSVVVLSSCIDALQKAYFSPGFQLGDEDRHYYALTLLQAARLYQHENAGLLDMKDIANRAAAQFLHLVQEGRRGYHGYLAESLHLLSLIMESSGDPDWGQPLADAQHVLSRMHHPLCDEDAAVERAVEQRAARRG
jgi:hypothetical protein